VHVNQTDTMVTDDIIPLLTYQGILTQNLISDMLETIEHKLKDDDISKGLLAHVSIIFIELCQNMINYSKDDIQGSKEFNPYGFIGMYKSLDSSYILSSKNIISMNDKKRILTRLLDINTLDKDEVKERYKELRRSARHAHSKGAGIGLYDIAKRCSNIKYTFENINDNKFYFSLRVEIEL
jgi:hypothetical protein